MGSVSLVIGASGFLGSHVTRQLVERGDDVRVMLRRTSTTRAIDDLPVERHYGDVFDNRALGAAMDGCDVVFYCVVDVRPWLYDPAPMWRTNVDGLKNVLDVALGAGLHRFVFTSSSCTIGLPVGGPATEELPNNWMDRVGSDYVQTRVAAENLLLEYCRDKGLPGVAMCVSNTYGPGDWAPTTHGGLLAAAVRAKSPVYFAGAASEVVGVVDAAQALLLAGERGRIGERYIISERFMSIREINEIGCAAVGVTPPRYGVPISLVDKVGAIGTAVQYLTKRDVQLKRSSLRLLHFMPPMDHGKAVHELGWDPAPAPEAIRQAARFFTSRPKP